MLLKVVYVLTCRIVCLIVVLFRGDQAAVAEVLVLRHENALLRRHAGRVRYEPADRAWFAALARIVSRWRWAEVFPVTPRRSWPGTGGWPRRSTTRAGGAAPAVLRPPRVSSDSCCAWRVRIRCGATAGSTVSCLSSASPWRPLPSGRSCTPQASIRCPAAQAPPGSSSCASRQPGS